MKRFEQQHLDLVVWLQLHYDFKLVYLESGYYV